MFIVICSVDFVYIPGSGICMCISLWEDYVYLLEGGRWATRRWNKMTRIKKKKERQVKHLTREIYSLKKALFLLLFNIYIDTDEQVTWLISFRLQVPQYFIWSISSQFFSSSLLFCLCLFFYLFVVIFFLFYFIIAETQI